MINGVQAIGSSGAYGVADRGSASRTHAGRRKTSPNMVTNHIAAITPTRSESPPAARTPRAGRRARRTP